MRRLHLLALTLFALAPLLPAQKPDLAAAERQLDSMFDRPRGQPIGDEQKDRLKAWLEQHQGQDLAHLGYAKALHLYLERDYDGAAAALDGFFAQHPSIKNREHRTMAGRVYLNAVRLEGDKAAPDLARLSRWGQNMTRLYDDAAILARISKSVTQRVKDPAPLRVALARGVFQSELPDSAKDDFLKELYAEVAPASRPAGRTPASRPGAPALPIRRTPAAAAPAADTVQVGALVEGFAADPVLGGPERFDLQSYRGKVVVLDFFATWCPPCRASVPGLVALQKELGDDLQVLGVTRFYGRGMDFSDAAATLPHGGKSVSQLDQSQELAINRAFRKAFAVNYPLVFASDDVTRGRFGVTGIPTAFVIGRDGKLVGKVVGGGEAQHATLRELIETARKAGR